MRFALLFILTLGACDCGGSSATPCATITDCEAGEICLDGRCEVPPDRDGGADTAIPRDGARPDTARADADRGDTTTADANEDAICGGEAIAIDYRPPNVLVVFDRSCSMRRRLDDTSLFGTGPDDSRTRWATARDAVMRVVRRFEPRVFWGLMAYPDPREGCGMPADAEVLPGPLNADAIEFELARNRVQPFGLCGLDNSDTTTQPRQTPTHQALQSAATLTELMDPTRPSFVLLVTDGGESCASNEMLVSQTIAMRDAGIGVAVLAFTTGADVTSLEAIASNGGLPAPGAPPSYHVAEDGAALELAFADLTASFVSCDLVLASVPPDGEAIFVFVDDVELVEDAASGWTYDSASNSVTLHGATCDRLRAGDVTRINVAFGCPTMTCTPQPEVCNGLDEDCDDVIDEGCLL